MADLLRTISIPVEMDFIGISSYSSSTQPGVCTPGERPGYVHPDRHVLFIEDVIDTGLTLSYLLKNIRSRQPASLEVCCLLTNPNAA